LGWAHLNHWLSLLLSAGPLAPGTPSTLAVPQPLMSLVTWRFAKFVDFVPCQPIKTRLVHFL
jgi:hypothetical protein